MTHQKNKVKSTTSSTEAGFTLIEVMVSLVIFAFGILAVLGMQVTAIRGGHQSQNLSEAASAGANMIETLISQDYATLADGNDTVDGKYTLTWDVNENTSGELTGTKSIDLTVRWTEGSRTHEVAYEFLNARDI
jgi:type IV pilus modification protein PilV